jgi:hypothetical protein
MKFLMVLSLFLSINQLHADDAIQSKPLLIKSTFEGAFLKAGQQIHKTFCVIYSDRVELVETTGGENKTSRKSFSPSTELLQLIDLAEPGNFKMNFAIPSSRARTVYSLVDQNIWQSSGQVFMGKRLKLTTNSETVLNDSLATPVLVERLDRECDLN